MKKIVRWLLRGIAALFLLILLLSAISFLINRGLPSGSENPAELSSAEKARLSEFSHARRELGDEVWPGWGTAEIPTLLYNESYAFLVGGSGSRSFGWQTVPQYQRRGGDWETVHAVPFIYFRQPLQAGAEPPQAFTVKVGNRWAASMTTMEWMEIKLANQFRDDLPPFLVPIFPYPLVTNLFIRGSEGYISLLAHESFHAYQGMVAEERLVAAETAVSRAESEYPWAATEAAWQIELDLLADALQAQTEAETADLARQFLAQRTRRREDAALSPILTDYERQREWLEGLARYVELEIWHQASLGVYAAVPALRDDPDFSGYDTYNRRWLQEIDQIRRMAGDEGDGRFYYSGMAQAVLLDRLIPGWKEQALEDGVFLEDLLETAVIVK